jgi:hypothetical protein
MVVIEWKDMNHFVLEIKGNSSGRGRRRRRSEEVESKRFLKKSLLSFLYFSHAASFQMNNRKREE